MSEILDSGSRREFETGAVRDIVEGKGRCDLLPLDAVADLFSGSLKLILNHIDNYIRTGDLSHISAAIRRFFRRCVFQ